MPTTVRPFAVHETAIPGLWVIDVKEVTDERGTVREFYRESAFAEAGLPSFGPFPQVNVTETVPGGVRGVHAEDMYKLVGIASGAAKGVYVDLRPGDGRGTVVEVDLVPGVQVLVSPGIGNAFQALGDQPVQYLYCFTDEWSPTMAGTAVTPLDPALGVEWPIPLRPDDPSSLSAKDAGLPTVAELG